jgi:hypothetical protein
MNRENVAGLHPGRGVLIRAVDGELPDAERRTTQEHLAACEQCHFLYEQLRRLSTELETLVSSASFPVAFEDRQELWRQMEARESSRVSRAESAESNFRFILRRFGWSMALAASLAFAVIIMPHVNRKPGSEQPPVVTQTSALEIDGESFIPLPYSNPDLPVNSSRIVQMQVPVSSLTEAGIVFEPVANGYRNADRTVLADVLIGADGQPLGVHILGVD